MSPASSSRLRQSSGPRAVGEPRADRAELERRAALPLPLLLALRGHPVPRAAGGSIGARYRWQVEQLVKTRGDWMWYSLTRRAPNPGSAGGS